jgi:hypothetical protein
VLGWTRCSFRVRRRFVAGGGRLPRPVGVVGAPGARACVSGAGRRAPGRLAAGRPSPSGLRGGVCVGESGVEGALGAVEIVRGGIWPRRVVPGWSGSTRRRVELRRGSSASPARPRSQPRERQLVLGCREIEFRVSISCTAAAGLWPAATKRAHRRPGRHPLAPGSRDPTPRQLPAQRCPRGGSGVVSPGARGGAEEAAFCVAFQR